MTGLYGESQTCERPKVSEVAWTHYVPTYGEREKEFYNNIRVKNYRLKNVLKEKICQKKCIGIQFNRQKKCNKTIDIRQKKCIIDLIST